MPLGNKITVNSDKSLEDFLANIREHYEKHKYLTISVKTGKQRTSTQNNSMHLYCEQVADELNSAGFDFRAFIREGIHVSFTRDLVKEYMWRVIQRAMFEKESTTELTRQECSEVYEVLNKHLSEKGIHVPWPHKGE